MLKLAWTIFRALYFGRLAHNDYLISAQKMNSKLYLLPCKHNGQWMLNLLCTPLSIHYVCCELSQTQPSQMIYGCTGAALMSE